MITQFPEVITIDGFVYKKMSQGVSGGAYYDSYDNPSEITSKSICLYPNGELTYSWRGIEQKWNKSFRVIRQSTGA
ncbi:hypothetical protein [Butyrivibrio sp. XPD2006]|uniref:hypothetical protein n=1 Tax=Butyrivibrio sp. XPD2006 TaxID=1280668 RepID=UPI0003B6088F|nr:hypothetical protein [Butyrivibrio sp. XPD2006]